MEIDRFRLQKGVISHSTHALYSVAHSPAPPLRYKLIPRMKYLPASFRLARCAQNSRAQTKAISHTLVPG